MTDLQQKKQEVLTAWQEYENALVLADNNRERARTGRAGVYRAIGSGDKQKVSLYFDEATSAKLQEELDADANSKGARFDHLSRELLKIWD